MSNPFHNIPIAEGGIDGVKIVPLKKFADERGVIMHGVRKDTALSPFGEVYFKKLYSGVINGWHVHDEMELNYICVYGMIKLVLYDVRENSPTHKQFQEIFYGDDNYCLVHIPPGVANASKSLQDPFSIMCNVASLEHDPTKKYPRIDPNSDEIPYGWTKKDY